MFPVDRAARQTSSSAAAQRPGVAISVDDDDDDTARQQVIDSLVSDFLRVVENSVDRQTAQQYLTSNQMDVEAALNAFYNDPTL